MSGRIPVTVLTGYLGAGKTTLLNRILSEDHGRRYAVIVNEFGEVGIDNDLIVNTDEELFEMNNGCICCTVRGDLIRTLHALLRRSEGGPGFDAIIVETTGLADPGPVAQTFFVDDVLQSRTVLDSIATVVDAKHILLRLSESREAEEQVAFADQLVLNKMELASEDELRAVESRLRQINPLAPIHRAQRANLPLDLILQRRGFDLQNIVALEPAFLAPAHGEPGHVHDDACPIDAHGSPDDAAHGGHQHRDAPHDHEHDSSIRSVSLTSRQPIDVHALSRWLTELVASQGEDILRAKGIIDAASDHRRFVFQSVHMLVEGDFQRPWKAGEERYSRLVFIGRHLDEDALRASFLSCLAGKESLNDAATAEAAA